MGEPGEDGVGYVDYPAKDFGRLNLKDEISPGSPAPPTLTGSFRDVTAEFFEASEKLKIGQLVKDPHFTLLRAVGALEIMDPKMDSGLLEAQYESFDALQPRLPEEVIGIMDQLLSHEMAWHTGSALSQTLFTSLYIDKLLSLRPSTLAEAAFSGSAKNNSNSADVQLLENALRPYCIALIKCCHYTNQQIMPEQVYEVGSKEDEDFVAQVYGVNLLEAIETSDIISLLDDSISWIENSGESYSEEARHALKYRLLFRKSLLLVFSSKPEEWSSDASERWDTALRFARKVEETHKIAIPVPSAFSISVQRKLVSQVPPRDMVDYSFEDAVSNFKKLCIEGRDILKILDFDGPTNLLNYFLSFVSRRPPPLPYVRSLLQTLYFGELNSVRGKWSTKTLLYVDLKELVYPMDILLDPQNELAEMPEDPRFEITRKMNWFVERAGKAYLELFRNICQNRSRLRRNLCHSILDWDSLQIEAEDVDSELRLLTNEESLMTHSGPSYSFALSSWVYFYKLRQMEWIILLGFELEIFQPHEFAGMYCYLHDYVCTRIGHLERMRLFASRPHSKPSPDRLKTLSLLNFYLLETEGFRELSSALVNLYTALSRLNLLKKPPQPFSTDLLRYEARMKPFFTITCPEVVPFKEFQSRVNSLEQEIPELLGMASSSVNEAKKVFDQLSKLDVRAARAVLCEEGYRTVALPPTVTIWIGEMLTITTQNMREILRSCIGVGVAVAVLSGALSEGRASVGMLNVEIDRARYHPSFPAPKITVVKR